MPKKEYM